MWLRRLKRGIEQPILMKDRTRTLPELDEYSNSFEQNCMNCGASVALEEKRHNPYEWPNSNPKPSIQSIHHQSVVIQQGLAYIDYNFNTVIGYLCLWYIWNILKRTVNYRLWCLIPLLQIFLQIGFANKCAFGTMFFRYETKLGSPIKPSSNPMNTPKLPLLRTTHLNCS